MPIQSLSTSILQNLDSSFIPLLLFSTSPFYIVFPLTLQAHMFMGFPRQEYRSGLPFPSPGDLPDSGLTSGLDSPG